MIAVTTSLYRRVAGPTFHSKPCSQARFMPIYEYSCKGCGTEFELLIRGSTRPSCPECDGEELERRLSLPRVKSSGTRDLAMRAAKKRDASQAKDRMHEQLKYERSHDRHG